MCSRFLFSEKQNSEEVRRFCAIAEQRFGGELWSRGEILPGMCFPVLLAGKKKAEMKLMNWGYSLNSGNLLINARSESVDRKPVFAADFRERRCAVLTTGFYEWGKDEERTKFLFTGSDPVMYLAGICNLEGKFAILTTQANGSVKGIHHRMPVILPKGKVLTWLNDVDAARGILTLEMPSLTAEDQAEDEPGRDFRGSWNPQ